MQNSYTQLIDINTIYKPKRCVFYWVWYATSSARIEHKKAYIAKQHTDDWNDLPPLREIQNTQAIINFDDIFLEIGVNVG